MPFKMPLENVGGFVKPGDAYIWKFNDAYMRQ